MDDPTLQRFADFLVTTTGLSFAPTRQRELLRGMAAVARDLEMADPYACMEWLMSRPVGRSEVELLARRLTVGETYFLREPAVFDALEQQVLPALIAERRRQGQLTLRLWSAACCTGEEPYTLAVLLSRLLPDLADWRITIVGTDINPYFLRKAEAALYQPWSFRNVPSWFLHSYFTPVGSGFALRPDIRALVTFRYLNLADAGYPSIDTHTGAMDLILCRNVLMYFAPAQAVQVVERLYASLRDQGWLVVGAAETSRELFARFGMVSFPDALLYRKGGVPARQPEPPAFEPPPLVPLPALEPEPPPAYEVALACYRCGEYREAAAALARARPDAATLLLAARIDANLGELDAAEASCRRALALDKLDAAARYLLAAILEEQGRTEEAMAELKRALFLAPDFVLAHVALGHLAHRLGRGNAAKHFDNALALLQGYRPDAVLPESDGLTASRLAEMIRTVWEGQ